MNVINITTQYITVGQFLKFVGIVDNGAMSKHYLEKNIVKINDVPETRRGKKLFNGDVVLVENKKYQIRIINDVLS